MKRTIYHGSDHIIQKPVYGFGKENNDYGLGFYCCSQKSLAEEWASKVDGVPGIVNKYEIIDDGLKILDLTKPPFDNPFYWVAVLVHFKKLPSKLVSQCSRELAYLEKEFYVDVSQYDVVIGYRADDNYYQFPQALIRSDILISSLRMKHQMKNIIQILISISLKQNHFLNV